MSSREVFSILLFFGLIALVYLCEISLLFRFIADKLQRKPRDSKLFSKSTVIIHILAIVGIACFSYGYFIEPYQIETKTIDITTSKLKNTSLRIVQISDLHCDLKIRNEKKLIGLVNRLQPDLIVFTGDAVNKPGALQTFKATMRKLKAKIAKVAVNGNWDLWYSSHLDIFSDTGFKELKAGCQRFVKNGETFTVCGLAYEYFYRIPEILKDLQAQSYTVFLHHTPNLADDVRGSDIDLYLAGHTHGGQVVLPFYGALITFSKHGKKYESGKYFLGNTLFYVNRGIGMEGGNVPRVRFFARPEITVFDIRPEK